MKKLLLLVCASVLACGQARPAETGLLSHWRFDVHGITNGTVRDLAGTMSFAIEGPVDVRKVKDIDYLSLSGKDQRLSVRKNIAEAALPKKEMSVEVWAAYSNPTADGGFIGAFQDSGPVEYGWVVGYSGLGFRFGLSSKGADDGDGKITYITANEPIGVLGKWYHIAATYDGTTMTLYVNGAVRKQSTVQSGDINYPGHGVYEIASYHDDDEDNRMSGKLHEIKVFNRALTQAEVQRDFNEHRELTTMPGDSTGFSGIIAGPYLQFATKTSITVLWETAEDASTVVDYGEAQFLHDDNVPIPLPRTSAAEGARTMHEVTLTGLSPETEYLYRVTSVMRDGTVLKSDVYTFKTAVNDSTAYTFGFVSDTQNNPPVWGKIAQYLFNERPNFILHGGDIVGNGNNKLEWLDEFLKPAHVLMSRIPMYAAIGNHENNHDNYYQYMANPAPEDYFTFTYGNAQIFIIDDNKDLSQGSAQRTWLEKELKASKAKWKFAVHHHPPFNSDEDDYGNTWRGRSTYGDVDVRTIVPLYEQYGVDIVFNGHIHDYERTFPITGNRTVEHGGVVYITAGGGGGGLENYAPNRSWFTAKMRSEHHFLLVGVNGGTLHLQALDHNWQLFDSMTITK